MPFIMLAVLIDMAAIGIIIPVLPTLVGSFATSQADQAYWYGVTAVAFGVSNFLASPVLGALSDRFGRRPVLLLGFMGLGVSFFGVAMTTSLWGADRGAHRGRGHAGQRGHCQRLCGRHFCA
jgi:MFS transporter, DHA1 family, tetracycline resistance protein